MGRIQRGGNTELQLQCMYVPVYLYRACMYIPLMYLSSTYIYRER